MDASAYVFEWGLTIACIIIALAVAIKLITMAITSSIKDLRKTKREKEDVK